MADSRFSDDEIERERRGATSRKANVDEEQVALKKDLLRILESGTLEQLEQKLERYGLRYTAKGEALVAGFNALRGGPRL